MALHEIEVDLSRNESCVTPIAVVGMAFRFPGDLGDELSFWQALTDKRDLVTQIDSQRWDTERLQHPKTVRTWKIQYFCGGSFVAR
ncbi:beta-ketoacyl synthase N-terminal-like domain-containing protein [Candidatus Aalborgicola defluviihabitans]|uniref:beta-ketoacyl synthase N-terminal-like domain-containing protein n=1 Tax=Candidatus Aalborgicola defluviihabitans TaxID=3386187 RepID=UPI0039B8D70E